MPSFPKNPQDRLHSTPRRKVHLVCFATPDFYRRQQLLCNSAVRLDVVDHAIPVTREDILRSDFGLENRVLLEQKRGAGYWAWKPHLILQAMEGLDDGDWVLYSDVGRSPRALTHELGPLFDWCVENGQPFMPGARCPDLGPAICWTKERCAARFGFDEDRLKGFRQVAATWSLWSKCEESIAFLKEWKALSLEPGLIDDSPSGGVEARDFIEHRHDQSILSCLLEQKGLLALFEEIGPGTPNHRKIKDLDFILGHLGGAPSGKRSTRLSFRIRRSTWAFGVWLYGQAGRLKKRIQANRTI